MEWSEAAVGADNSPRRCISRLVSLGAFLFGVLLTLRPTTAQADDRVIVRGNYYREHSTRVLQPQIVFQKDLLERKVTLSADYLLDSISSASIAAGAAALGGDKVFTEWRHESGGSAQLHTNAWTFLVGGRYSTETDYTASNISAGVTREFFERRTQIGINYASAWNRAYRVRNNIGDRSDWKSTGDTNLLRVHLTRINASHIFHRRVLAGISGEWSTLRGPQDNPYRRARNGQPERHPLERNRFAIASWLRFAVSDSVTIAPHYRYYADDWQIQSHAADLRVHWRIVPMLRVRARYRYYWQSGSYFWRADGEYDPEADYVTDDPKVAQFHSHTPGIQLAYQLDTLGVRLDQHWLARGWIAATYNHVFQTSRFPSARLGSLEFSGAF